jgi:clan AA aspartic protease (TIGR02281 family)
MPIQRRLFTAAALLLATTTFAHAEEGGDLLKSRNLTTTGNQYVLPAEKELIDGMKNVLTLRDKVKAEAKQREELEKKIKIVKTTMQQWEFQYRAQNEEFSKIDANKEPDKRNTLAASINALVAKLKEGETAKGEIEAKVNAIGTANKEAFITAVLDLGNIADKAQADYKELAADEKIKAALETVNKTAKLKMRLGPTQDFNTKVALLKTMRTDVASAVIPIKVENNTSTVEVTFNGTVTRALVLDTGAGLVTITADLAEQLKLVPGPTDPTLRLTMADGRMVEAKLMILKSVRVGQFTVKDVECAVLPKTMVAAEPLLGGSFLTKFIVKIDPKAGELHLSAITDGKEKVSSDPKDAKKEPAKDSKKP